LEAALGRRALAVGHARYRQNKNGQEQQENGRTQNPFHNNSYSKDRRGEKIGIALYIWLSPENQPAASTKLLNVNEFSEAIPSALENLNNSGFSVSGYAFTLSKTFHNNLRSI
jgi:hypothetical protein